MKLGDLSRDGLPLQSRGALGLDFAGYLDTDGSTSAVASDLVLAFPLGRRTYLDVVLPLSVVVPLGNPTVGAHHVARLADSVWLTVGGAVGVPLLSSSGDNPAGGDIDDGTYGWLPRALWNTHLYYPDIVPFAARLGLEVHAGLFEVRIIAEPITWFPTGNGDEVDGAFQHAVEGQVGHGIGGGLRLQGVVMGVGDDNYQLAVEPFLVIERELVSLRLGMMLPLDHELGPAFADPDTSTLGAWGFHLATGVRLD